MLHPIADARAGLRLAKQKIDLCRAAIAKGKTGEALGQLHQCELNVEDAMTQLDNAERKTA